MGIIIELLQRRIWLGPLIAVLLLLGGFGSGLLLGWSTVEFKPGADDVAAVADSYSLNNNADLAKARLKGLSKTEQERIVAALVRERTARGLTLEADRLTKLGQALGLSISPGAVPTAPSGTGTPRPSTTPTPAGATSPASLLVPALVIVLVIVLVVAAGLVAFLRVLPGLRRGRAPRAPRVSEPAPTPLPAAQRPTVITPGAPAPTTAPGGLGRFVPSYTLGQDNYDTSYSLETPRGEFLGETGMGISETIGEGKPDKVTAFDLWLFDKADVRTVTQILMSEYAFRDQMLRTKLASKGEAVLAEKGRTIRLETQSLRIDAQIVELIYATAAGLAPNSHFQKLIVEIVPTLKEGAMATR